VTIRIPGLRGGGGGAALASEAAVAMSAFGRAEAAGEYVLMPFGSLGSTAVVLLDMLAVDALGVADSLLTMVEVDEDRLKVLARGARCVSLSSVTVRRRNKITFH
jgi:hypothetical protein